ncbi:MAG TPA: methyltransferase domain-containing protein [Candidatus Cloacimonadota bacterium]|nr:methyltransferase domain-containing protein [Candidatus Cloacimonadota bacterium]HPT72315.1 methyltransferase domain-containing protein [Candidatus Cloacimonadota bacterium]
MSNKTESFFNKYSVGFDSIYGNDNSLFKKFINKHFRKTMRIRFEMTIEGCDPIEGKSVLDIGCGPGHYSIALAKNGASKVYGIDFAQNMIDLATEKAQEANVQNICKFEVADFNALDENNHYDYSVIMGFMDYMANPLEIMQKVMRITDGKAFFSFPCAGGILGLQRQIRYKFKCPLYLYSQQQLEFLMKYVPCSNYNIEKIDRDFFVTITK